MTIRAKALVCAVVAGAIASLYSTPGYPSSQWVHFFVYLAAILLSSGMKVAMPKSNGTMSVNFPFILLGILQLSPLQATLLAAASVIAQCRIRVIKPFSLVQILFNVANVTTATVLAWHTYVLSLSLLNREVAPALAVAAMAYFLANTIPLALILGWESGASPVRQWLQEFPWYLPFYFVGAVLAASADWVGIHFGWLTSLLLIPMVYTVYRAYMAQMARVRERERHLAETEALHLRTIEGLAMAVEAKDKNTHRHLMRVRVYVSELGKLMGLDRPVMQALVTAAFLHDIGKLAVPEYIINKPGKLTPEEFEKMKIHPVVGADILERVHFPYPVVPIVRSHHEAWDGSGYPDGLKCEEIPIGARILTAVDCFDALASDRPYRRALPIEQAMEFVKSKAGIQFDPEVVRLLDEHFLRLEELARKQIEEVEPLKTDLFIERGTAPGAGFAPGQDSPSGDSAGNGSSGLAADAQIELFGRLAEAIREAESLVELSQAMGTALSPRELSATMCARLQRSIPFDCFAVYGKKDDNIELLYAGGPSAPAFSAAPIPVGEGLSGWVAQSARPIVNGNPTVEPNYVAGSNSFTAASSALSIPLFNLSGSVFAVLSIYSSKPAAFSPDHLRILQAIESRLALALEGAMRFQPAATEAQDESKHDALTQLSNLRGFLERLDAEVERARNSQQTFAVVVCDLKSLKSVNDRYGYTTGNQLLRAVGRAFRDCSGPEDIVARIGGDEFALLFPAMDTSSAESQLEILHLAVARMCADQQIEPGLPLTVGSAFYPQDGEKGEELLAKAERKLEIGRRRSPDPRRRQPQSVLTGASAR
ncbi:MAG TPA: HD domain-containing phosphohydrolase [Terracidiphilus sp.]|nr:HD domain-containing phosphohydrolase [Terracidiphilus sp.]